MRWSRRCTPASPSYVHTYNHLIAQRALDHRSPVQALRQWRSDKPELFRKQVNDLPGLDSQVNITRYEVSDPRLVLGEVHHVPTGKAHVLQAKHV